MNIEAITLTVIDSLNAEGFPYLLAGSFSSNYYGIPRSTHDADFVLDATGRTVAHVCRHLTSEFRFDPQMLFESVTGTYKNVIRVADSEFQVELFRLSDDPHDRERFRRKQSVWTLDRNVYLPTKEDVIITKLRWALHARRSKDSDDARDVIAVQGDNIDWDYVRYWCDAHGTRELLDQIRRQVPSI